MNQIDERISEGDLIDHWLNARIEQDHGDPPDEEHGWDEWWDYYFQMDQEEEVIDA